MKIHQLLLILLFSCCFALAQSQIVLNPKAGVNFSGLEEELEEYDAQARVGFNFGLDARMPGENAVYFNPGIHFYRYTARLIQEPSQGAELREESSISALKVPLRVGYRLTGEGGLVGLHLRGGVVPTFILGANETRSLDFDVDDLKSFTLGADIGMCVEIFNLITADFNYELGLTDYLEEGGDGNNVLTLSFGLKF